MKEGEKRKKEKTKQSKTSGSLNHAEKSRSPKSTYGLSVWQDATAVHHEPQFSKWRLSLSETVLATECCQANTDMPQQETKTIGEKTNTGNTARS